jgi:hypothetical protein
VKYVYAIRFGRYVKIGLTADLPNRLAALPKGVLLVPRDIDAKDREPLCAFPGELETERFLHGWLSDYRAVGEFFELPDELVEKLRQHNSNAERTQMFRINPSRPSDF